MARKKRVIKPQKIVPVPGQLVIWDPSIVAHIISDPFDIGLCLSYNNVKRLVTIMWAKPLYDGRRVLEVEEYEFIDPDNHLWVMGF